jgi:hypothetical protein
MEILQTNPELLTRRGGMKINKNESYENTMINVVADKIVSE